MLSSYAVHKCHTLAEQEGNKSLRCHMLLSVGMSEVGAFIMRAFSSDLFQIPISKGSGLITQKKIIVEPDCSTDRNL